MKLAAKLMLVFLAVVMLMTAVSGYFSVRRGFEQFRQHQEKLATETARAIDARLAEAWRQGGAKGLLSAMEEMQSPGSANGIRWVWFEQTQGAGGEAQTAVFERLSVNGESIASTTVTDQFGRRQLRTYHPVDLGSGPRGGLELTGSLEEQDLRTRDTVIISLASIGLIALSSLALVYIAGLRWVAKPLDRLIAKTQQIANGDFSKPVTVEGHDELSQLAGALNSMSDQLAKQQQRIHEETIGRLTTLEQLRHADRLKTVGRLAAGLAHELGTPLNVMSGRAGLITSGKLSSDEIVASAATIKAEADRVTTIIRQLLDFARPSKSRRATLDMGQLVKETIALLEPLAEKRNVHIEVADTPDLRLSADRSQMQQVLTNIIVNAVQSMPHGGTVTVTLRDCEAKPPSNNGSDAQRCVAVAVRDQGSGIPESDLEQIFEPFFTTKDVGDGTGLGLSIAYGIVQEHNGWIDVESEVGRGSCFTVYLPRE